MASAAEQFSAFREAVESGKCRAAEARAMREQRYAAFDAQAGTADETQRQEAEAKFLEREHAALRYHRQKFSLEDFSVVCELGSGGFGSVHLVKSKANASVFALKQMHKYHYELKNFRERAFAEREVLGMADSRWFTTLFATFQDEEHVYMVMEFVQGGELFRYMTMNSRLSPTETQFYMAELLLALEVVHKCGCVHRDVKPDNIMLTASGHLKLLDFGLCKYFIPEVSAPSSSSGPPGSLPARLQSCAGTPQYMAPESWDGTVTTASDLWALGVVTFECLYGKVPFHADNSDESMQTAKIKALVRNFARSFPKRLEKARGQGFMPPDAERMLKGLICLQEQRLSAADTRKEPFFQGLDFEHIHEMEPAIRPKVDGELDASNFEDSHRTSQLPPTDNSYLSKDRQLQWPKYTFDREAQALERPENVRDCFQAANSSPIDSSHRLRG